MVTNSHEGLINEARNTATIAVEHRALLTALADALVSQAAESTRHEKLLEKIRKATNDYELAKTDARDGADFEDGLDHGAAIRSATIRRLMNEANQPIKASQPRPPQVPRWSPHPSWGS